MESLGGPKSGYRKTVDAGTGMITRIEQDDNDYVEGRGISRTRSRSNAGGTVIHQLRGGPIDL